MVPKPSCLLCLLCRLAGLTVQTTDLISKSIDQSMILIALWILIQNGGENRGHGGVHMSIIVE